MRKLKKFQIEDIDGCEFIMVKQLGKAMISFDYDEDGCNNGKILVVYPDASYDSISFEKAQKHIDSGYWTVLR
jgi:hypothetical protein